MLRGKIEIACRRVSPHFNAAGVCGFSNGDILGFIDTSPERDGSRGIAFLGEKMAVNFGEGVREVAYKSIESVRIVSSFEDNFADELALSAEDIELRISDYSLDKYELKLLLEELRGDAESLDRRSDRRPRTEKHEEPAVKRAVGAARKTASSESKKSVPESVPESAERIEDIIFEEGAPVISETDASPGSGGYIPAPIPEEKIDWLSAAAAAVKERSPRAEIKTEVWRGGEEDEEDESAVLEQIQSMSHEETLSFLAQSINEINSDFEDSAENEPENSSELLRTIGGLSALPEEAASNVLTVEPVWGDIYIKASRNLRELCESGKLSMGRIETELKDKLLNSARAFAEVTADESKVPKVLMPRITELRSAANNFEQYFKSGEDIAVRAMFFMMYQMLSYADRIAETPETKERLNDFFRNFGTAGITLSMLDMRV